MREMRLRQENIREKRSRLSTNFLAFASQNSFIFFSISPHHSMGMSIIFALWIAFGVNGIACQGDSLRSALNAVDQRQRYLFDSHRVPYARENPTDLSYLPDSVSVGGNDLAEYFLGENDVGKQISSLFRERLEEGQEKPSRVLSNLETDDSFDGSEYHVKDPWHKYRNNLYPRNARLSSRNKKRQFYPEFGYDSIGLKKKDKYFTSDYSNEYNYLLNGNDDYPNDYVDNIEYNRRSAPILEDRYEHIRPYYWSNFRHIPVTKRSSEYLNISKDKKQMNQPPRTDPKVLKDLSTIFAASHTNNKVQKYPNKLKEVGKSEENLTNLNLSKTRTVVKVNDTKTYAKKISPKASSEKPIQISKKSIDWSDYFGLDRRKKNSDAFDREWLIDRYHKAIDASKKNADYSLHSFHDHDDKSHKVKNYSSDLKLENMDRKLKDIEDEIVDDALKYTGANEGVTDPKSIQEVEDGIISRLSKAYSVEKMRRALGEYKKLVDNERKKLEREGETLDDPFSEDKRISVPRKQAVDSNKDERSEDNHIKCTQDSEDCDEENYKTPIEVIEQMNYEVGDCPKIQRACSQVEPLLGKFGKIFEEACNIHQMCLLCGSNNWYPANRQCNLLYLSKVFDLCEGKTECQKELQKSIRYLININRSLRDNPSEDCNLVCPDGPDGL
ncbi:hypothetical protein HHI36_022786 [Cryptolaemus montrouzieri]|uniref:Uncharacterized protein n=1 Tax=Cryptolaemus montrouzieri TaxID=559131 RepID=A0ABD2PEL1_9CUCU